MRAGAQTCDRSYYDVYFGREARSAAPGRARRRAATERAKSDTKRITQGCNTSYFEGGFRIDIVDNFDYQIAPSCRNQRRLLADMLGLLPRRVLLGLGFQLDAASPAER